MTPGYSGTPLAKKLGIQAGSVVLLVDAPAEYCAWVEPLPDTVEFAARPGARVDLAHVFTSRKADVVRHLGKLRKTLRPDAAVWVSWPKKSANVPTDVTEDTLREVALPLGFVDTKVCAVSDVWSGLKLVVRKHLR